MKRSIFIILFLYTGIFFSQKQSQKIEVVINGFFNGLSLRNNDTLKYYSTADFQLLEDGQVWTMDTLIGKISHQNPDIKRINKFKFIKTVINEPTAWVSYENTAEFSLGEKKQTLRWLESAVVVRENKRWKIQMLHSTKLK